MKKGFLLAIFSILFAYDIKVVNGIKKEVNFNELAPYSHIINFKPSFDTKKSNYTFVFLYKLKQIYCPFSNKITFHALDNYEVTFTKNEIKKTNIVFAYKINNKPIPIEEKGPAKIIYLYDIKPLKEIFMIDRIICDK